ncbi:MAG: LytTR family DNA-binding domain-containing protein [Anaerovoracaceae bacterium]
MYIAICDDEKVCQDKIQHLLQQFMATKDIHYSIKCFFSGEDLISACKNKEHFDLIFLDIFLGDLDGIDTAKALRQLGISSELIFLTTSRDFAVESYQVSALSYLLKPLTTEAFEPVMHSFFEKYRPVKLQIKDCIFSISDLVFAESLDKKVVLHFLDDSTQIVPCKFEELNNMLNFSNFLRCHRCYIVNLFHVKKIINGDFLTVTNRQVLIRQKEYTAIKKSYYQFVLSQ